MRTSRRYGPFIAVVASVALASCQSPPSGGYPPHNPPWLTLKFKGTGSEAETINYYNHIDPNQSKRTLNTWKNANGFGTGPEAHATYFNSADLQLGRDMHCRQSVPFPLAFYSACYVTNYGPPPFDNVHVPNARNPSWPDDNQALADAVAGHLNAPDRLQGGDGPFATVAMEALALLPPSGPITDVRFYAFDNAGNILKQAALDGEGGKFIPQMCMACHGGQYDINQHNAVGASFLPFDVFTFEVSQTSGNQQESFRQLNALVEKTFPNPTNPNNPITGLIDNWYKSCGVNTPGCTPVDYSTNNLPPGWVGSGQVGVDAYFGVVRYYCQTCHVAEFQNSAGRNIDWTKYSNFKNGADLIKNAVCGSHSMPHAQIPFEHYFSNILAVAALQNFMQSLSPPSTC